MIGENYFHTGVTFTYGYAGNNKNGWSAKASFTDAGFCNDDVSLDRISTEGNLRTRYSVRDSNGVSGIRVAAKIMLNDLARMGIMVFPDFKMFFIDIEESLHASTEDINSLKEFAEEVGYEVILGK